MKISGMIFLMFFSCLTGCQSRHTIVLHARQQMKTGTAEWTAEFTDMKWKTDETAIIICDMWDRHWCDGATARVSELAPRINRVIGAARKKGMTIIHAPSETMKFYSQYPQRMKMESAVHHPSSDNIKDWYYLDPGKEPPLPVDDSDGGCDTNTQPENFRVWTRENPAITIDDHDGISDNGKEINNYFIENGIKNVILMGVHLNMCVLGRSFGIRGQIHQGRNVVVVRDLTDAMYNPSMPPYVSHDEGTRLILEHIEKYCCPSIESSDLM